MNPNTPNHRAVALWGIVFHGVSITIAFASGLLLVPLYLKYIPQDLYGAWSASGNILAWMSLVDPGLSTVLQQRVATLYGKRDLVAVGQWIGNGFIISVLISVFVAVVGWWVSFYVAAWMHLPVSVDAAALIKSFRLAVLGSSLMFIFFALSAVWIGLQGSWEMGLISSCGAVLRLVLVVVFLKKGLGLQSLVMPTLLCAVFMIGGYVVGLARCLHRKKIKVHVNLTTLREMGGFFSFTSLANMASLAVNQVDLVWTARLLGPDQVNILRFMRTPTSMSRLFVERPFLAVAPPLTHLYGSGNIARARAILIRMVRVMIWFVLFLAGGFLIYTHSFVSLWVGPQFCAGISVNVWIVVGYVFGLITWVLASACFSAGNIKGNSVSSIVQASIYIPMLLIFGYFWKMSGVVAAAAISVALVQGLYFPRRFVCDYQVSRDEWKSLLCESAKAVLVASFVGTIAWLRHPGAWFELILDLVIYFVMYVVLLLAVSAAARDEIRSILRYVSLHVQKNLNLGS